MSLAFQRANYVKELVPIVMDSKQDQAVRAQSLIALVETRAIGDKSALAFTERLLQANLIRSDYPEHFMWSREHPLLDALALRMPAGLEAVLEHYMTHMASMTYMANAARPDSPQRNAEDLKDIDDFWSELFYRSVERHRDSELHVLDDDDFLTKYLSVTDHLVDLVPGETRQRLGREWFTRQPKGIRILAAFRGIGDVGRDQHAAAREYLLSLVTPTNLTDSNLRLADRLIHFQQGKQWASKALATRCVEIILRGDTDMKLHGEAFNRALAAGSYIEWYAKTKRDSSNVNIEGDGSGGWEEIESVIVAALKTFLARVAKEPINAGEFGPNVKRLSIARPFAEILITGVEQGQKPSEATLQTMSEVFSLSDREVKALILEDLRPRWLEAMKKSHTPR